MPLPNFLIVGSQKSGTSWLHRSLGRSKHIFASQVKELNFFNQADCSGRGTSQMQQQTCGSNQNFV